MERATLIRATTLKRRMRQQDISLSELAQASGIQITNLSAYLSGRLRIGPHVEERLSAAIIRLGLHEQRPPKSDTPPSRVVTIRIRSL